MSYLGLMIICCATLVIIGLCITKVMMVSYKDLKGFCILLFSFSAFRYITLMVYGDQPSLQILQYLSYFYFASSIGLTMTTVSAIWYITPMLREKIKYPYFILGFLPWIAFYLFLIITQPTQIVLGERFGYTLVLTGKFSTYLSIAQGSFIGIAVILCLIGIFKYRNLRMRSQLFVVILAQVLLLLDGISYSIESIKWFQPFTVTEGFGFLAILYCFSWQVKEIKGICND